MKKLLVIVLALAMVFCMFACGKDNPEKVDFPGSTPITWICPYSISGGTGTMCNILKDFLEKTYGWTITVVEKSGGSGTVGTTVLATSKPDGYTVLTTAYGAMCCSPFTTGTEYKFEDIVPVGQISESYTIISTGTNNIKYNTWEEIKAAAVAAPGTITVSSSGNFGAHHVSMEVLSLAVTGKTGLFKHIPEDGGAASVAATIGGHYDLVAGIVSEQSKYFGLEKDGLKCLLQITKMKASETRFPDVPTCGDLGIDAAGGTWYMVVLPKGTPEAILKIWEDAIYAAMHDETVVDRFEKSNNFVEYLNRADAQKKYKEQYDSAETVMKAIYTK